MPRLADKFRLIAPDFPAFGFTTVHANASYRYSFAQMANTLGAFFDALELKRYALYVFDYGAPIGFRHALMRPERITGIISQNGNVYEEGLGEEMWKPVREYWREPTAKRREGLRDRLTFEGVKQAYLLGVLEPLAVSPEAYWLDAALMARPGNREIQLDLKLDYASNVAMYPEFQSFLSRNKPPTLAIWGNRDPFFHTARCGSIPQRCSRRTR